MSVARFLRTVGHLKPVQIYGRALHHAPKPAPRLAPAPPPRPLRGAWTAHLLRPPPFRGPDRHRHLNHEADIAAAQAWNHPAQTKLWLYNLHYFDGFAPDGDAQLEAWRTALLQRWIEENPQGFGVGWEPYPTSLRIVNWIKRHLAGAALSPNGLDSLATQARWLSGRLEWRLLGNHLLSNAKALVFAGLVFEGQEAERWRARGSAILKSQLAEQVLADGGHFERSPMYHALVVEDVLDLVNLARVYDAAEDDWATLAERMLAFQARLSHPDGRIAFFNDAAFGVGGELGQLQAYAARLGLRPAPAAGQGAWVGETGYGRLALGDAVVVLDLAPIGPDHLPGHAHADTLSFEWSLGVERIVVNGGVSVYGEGPQRARERSTASHSTVEIDGLDSSELWAGFRAGRRARVIDASIEQHEEGLTASAGHDGYAWRPGRPIHRRAWRLSEHRLTVTDRIEGGYRHAKARFHFPPGLALELESDARSGQVVTPAGRRITWTSSQPARIEPSEWRPEFGLRQTCAQLVVPMDTPELRLDFAW